MLDWLLTPLSGSAEHHVSFLVSWHGRLMVLAWAVMVPLGVIVARYFKVTRRQDWPRVTDNIFWWGWHKRLQYGGMAIALVAVGLAIASHSLSGGFRTLHTTFGWVVILLGVVQVVSAWLRGSKGGPTGLGAARGDLRGDHYDMSPHRYVFERMHKFGGIVAVLVSVAAVTTGLILADALRWMLIVIVTWWALLGAVSIWLQRQGRCIDTYQAIWGPELEHPGNGMKAVGPGVRRLSPGSTQAFGSDAQP